MIRSSYARLPERFFARIKPTPVAAPRLLKFNHALAATLGLPGLGEQALAGMYSGNAVPQELEPIAMAYAGHQFGQFVPQLGDGRAILLGEAQDGAGARYDIQLKGSGRTPYSRGGDGRAALGPVLREYLVSEAMHALGIPTTRSLAAVATGEPVFRETAQPGAIVTRVASSLVRVGTFQYFAARGDVDGVRQLADYVIERHYPQVRADALPYLALLRAVTQAQASLIARWMHVGFIHGVMNTDNMAVSGETIDFGPCAFMDSYDAAAVFSSIDSMGRYSYGNQPHAGAWNLARFAEALLPLIDGEPQRAVELAGGAVATFSTLFADALLAGFRGKLGLSSPEEDDSKLAEDWLEALQRNQVDFTVAFRALCDAAESAEDGARLRDCFANPRDYDEWAERWRARLSREPAAAHERAAAMRRRNPAYIPRNHRIEAVIRAAVDSQDFAPFEEMSAVLSRPYELQAGCGSYAEPPQPAERVLRTFCGT
jgi:serine/tyrosine/threonine adenylyltransferase